MSHQERNGVRAAYIHKAEHLEETATDATVVGRLSGCEQRENVSVCLNIQRLTIR